jgi:hypothetical protein
VTQRRFMLLESRVSRAKAAKMAKRRSPLAVRSALLVGSLLAASVFIGGGTASATPTPVGLGTATSYAVFAGGDVASTITNAVAGTHITGNVGLPAPFAKITGLVCANMTGTIFSTDGAGPAPCSGTDPGTGVENDARAAFNDASALPGATTLPADLAGQNLVSGLYSVPAASTNLSTTLTLNAQGDASSVWIFKASSTLITSGGSTVQFTNLPPGVTAAQLACNVFWTVGSSATISASDASATFVGTILASASITVNGPASGTATMVTGRLLAANQGSDTGSVTIPGLATITTPTGCPVLPAGTGGGPATTAGPSTPVVSPPAFTG